MKKVVCINDKNQPLGANVVEGKEYEVEEEYVNPLDQRVEEKEYMFALN